MDRGAMPCGGLFYLFSIFDIDIALKYVNNNYSVFIAVYMKWVNINCPPSITCLPFLLFLDTLEREEAREAIDDILSSLSLLIFKELAL